MKSFFAFFTLALGVLLAVSGCSSSDRPLVGLAIEIASIERTADGAQVTFRVINPNTVAYNIAGVTSQVYLNNQLVGTVKIDADIGVPPQMNVTQTGQLKTTKAALPTGDVSYRLESVLQIRLWGDNLQKLKVGGSGTVRVQG